jgi:putative lipoprotein
MRRSLACVVGAVILCAATTARAEAPSPEPDRWFGTDKALHFGAGFGLGVAGYAIGAGPIESRWAGVGLGIALAAALGGLKEGIDAAGSGQASAKDFVWDLIGSGLGVGVAITFDAALRGPDD